MYYTPSYGYAQSPYNPYNPYIPGAMIGADSSFVATQQYYVPSYENSSTYIPMVVQPGTDTYMIGTTGQYMDMTASTANRIDSAGANNNSLSATATYTMNPARGSSGHTNTPGKVSESFKGNGGLNKNPATSGGIAPVTVSGPASSQLLQVWLLYFLFWCLNIALVARSVIRFLFV